MKLFISELEIDLAIDEIANQLNVQGRSVTFVVILKGAICFIADLIRKLTIPFELTFISASSYGMRGMSPGQLELSGMDLLDLKGKEVIVVDDICDTGATLSSVCSEVERLSPLSVKTLVLLDKSGRTRQAFIPDMVCFDIDDLFVVGYGLDYKEQYRGLRGIYSMES